jgi:peptide/nickel transport system permease protein
MSVPSTALSQAPDASSSLWSLAWDRFGRDRVAVVCAVVVLLYVVVGLASGMGLIAADWSREVGISYAPPLMAAGEPQVPAEIARPSETIPSTTSAEDLGIVDPIGPELAEARRSLAAAPAPAPRAAALPFGGDKWGRDILQKTIKGTQTSVLVGLSAAVLAALIGTLFGAQAGYYGGRIDAFFNWLYSVFTSIPYLLLILAIAAVLNQKGTTTVVLILGLTGWTGIFRLVRAEYMKHKQREYVLAANAIGASHLSRMVLHILPNVSHVILVQLSIHVVLFIKSEVILSFLGFGVGVDTVSWGSMINEAQTELLNGRWWQLTSATVAMAVLVTAFSLLTDALRDALDPRLK